MFSISPRMARIAEGVFWIALLACSFVLPDSLPFLTQILVIGLFAVSLDIALGYAGILTVGHAAFFGAGAYIAGLLSKAGWGEPLSGLLVAAVAGGVLGYLCSWLIVRGADLTRLMITIGIGLLLYELANRFGAITGGADGLQGVQTWPLLGVFKFDLSGRTAYLYTLAITATLFAGLRVFLRSPLGLALKGVSENTKRMKALGSPVGARLRMAYTASALVAAVAGALMTQSTQFVGLDSLSFDKSAEVLIILILGGTGRLYGGLLGAIAYTLVHDSFSRLDAQFWMLGLGLFLVAFVLLGRGGLTTWLSRAFVVESRK
jgi:branched-chain amino acid transport system permease protein